MSDAPETHYAVGPCSCSACIWEADRIAADLARRRRDTMPAPESDVDAFNLPRPRTAQEYAIWIQAAERQRDRRLAIMRHGEKITGRLVIVGAIAFLLLVTVQLWSSLQCG